MKKISGSRRKIYTKGGDRGETALLFGPRLPKDHARFVVCGEIDELSSVLGVARAEGLTPKQDALVFRIQNELIEFSAEIVCPEPVRFNVRKIDREYIQRLEDEIDAIEAFLPPFSQFVIAGADKRSACLHLARTVCRRAERSLVALIRQEPEISPALLCYLNRLSDLLFVLACREGTARKESSINQ